MEDETSRDRPGDVERRERRRGEGEREPDEREAFDASRDREGDGERDLERERAGVSEDDGEDREDGVETGAEDGASVSEGASAFCFADEASVHTNCTLGAEDVDFFVGYRGFSGARLDEGEEGTGIAGSGAGAGAGSRSRLEWRGSSRAICGGGATVAGAAMGAAVTGSTRRSTAVTLGRSACASPGGRGRGVAGAAGRAVWSRSPRRSTS